MKKLTLLIYACLCTATIACSQAVQLGVFAGPNLSTLGSQSMIGVGETAALTFGAHAGLYTEITAGHWSIEPAVVYAGIGGRINSIYSLNSYAGYEDVHLQYLQVPVNILYNTAGRKFFFGGGPYIGFGLSGSESGSSTYLGVTDAYYNDKYTFYSGNKLDYGINLLAGLHVAGGTFFTIGCSLGLRQATSLDYIIVRNDVISLSIGHSIF